MSIQKKSAEERCIKYLTKKGYVDPELLVATAFNYMSEKEAEQFIYKAYTGRQPRIMKGIAIKCHQNSNDDYDYTCYCEDGLIRAINTKFNNFQSNGDRIIFLNITVNMHNNITFVHPYDKDYIRDHWNEFTKIPIDCPIEEPELER